MVTRVEKEALLNVMSDINQFAKIHLISGEFGKHMGIDPHQLSYVTRLERQEHALDHGRQK